MNEFWFWLIRPIGEFLGGVLLVALIFFAIVVGCTIAEMRKKKS